MEFIKGTAGLISWIAITVFFFWVLFRICLKMGYDAGVSILLFIPVVNFVVLIYLAFREWPIERELREVRMEKLRLTKLLKEKRGGQPNEGVTE